MRTLCLALLLSHVASGCQSVSEPGPGSQGGTEGATTSDQPSFEAGRRQRLRTALRLATEAVAMARQAMSAARSPMREGLEEAADFADSACESLETLTEGAGVDLAGTVIEDALRDIEEAKGIVASLEESPSALGGRLRQIWERLQAAGSELNRVISRDGRT